MINCPLRKKRKILALVSSRFHVYDTNIANNAQCAVPEAAPESKIEESTPEPVAAEENDTASVDVATNVDKATEESPTAEGDTKAPSTEVDATPDSSHPAPEATEETSTSESPGSNEDKQSKEADFPPIDPGAGTDAPAVEEESAELAVSRWK